MTNNIFSETIFAMASAFGKAGVSIFRISGAKSTEVLESITRSSINQMQPRKMYLRKLYVPNTNKIIDSALIVYFQKEHSFTGESLVELHTHGSIAVIKQLTTTLLQYKNLRLAEAGEFARRAFLNGKMDLTAAEGVADLIDAETEMQHEQAIKQMSGALSNLYDQWRHALIHIMGLVEAYIDFPDEDIPDSVLSDVSNKIDTLKENFKNHLDDNRRGERLRSGIKLAIIGVPNAGKSSLINLLTGREISIISHIAGTTRDVIEGHIDIGGYPIILQDTAGIRDISQNIDIIEQEGIKRAKYIAEQADIKIIIFNVTLPQSEIINNINQFGVINLIDKNTIIVFNKIDLIEKNLLEQHKKQLGQLINSTKCKDIIFLSIKKQQGLNDLLQYIQNIAHDIAHPSEVPQITRARHRIDISKALNFLNEFSFNKDLVLAAEDLRMAIRSLSYVTGKITVEEILEDIFSKFCIGK